jgi:hypothetical protein
MPYRNRVTPMGDIEAIPLRGAWTGNRGNLHSGHQVVRLHNGDHWVTCTLRFKDRHNEQWLPRRLTWLFFHDEAVSFAAGHRPCGECRYRDYKAYQAAWAEELGVESPSAKQMSRQLHGERLVRGARRRRLHELAWDDLPDGTFVLTEGVPAIVVGARSVEWTEAGYRTRRPRPVRGDAQVITPPSTVAVLRSGYPVQIDDGARTS